MQGAEFGVTEGAVWKQMKKNLDHSTKDWNIKNKLKFLAKISKVKGRIKQAQKIGEETKNGSASKDDAISRVIVALPVLKTNLDILTKTEEILQKDSVKNCKKRLEKLWQDYDTSSIVFDYTGVEEDGGGENPKDSLDGSFSKGILSLVVKSPSKLSKSPFSRRILLLSITKNRKKIRKIMKREYRILFRAIRCRLQGFLVIWQIMGWMNFASMSTYNISFLHTEKKRTQSGNRHWITDLNIWLPERHRMRKIWNLC